MTGIEKAHKDKRKRQEPRYVVKGCTVERRGADENDISMEIDVRAAGTLNGALEIAWGVFLERFTEHAGHGPVDESSVRAEFLDVLRSGNGYGLDATEDTFVTVEIEGRTVE